MSDRARRATSETSVIASTPRSGSDRPTTAAASARVITTDRLCETMSCSSRAIRVRSAAAAITACWSRSISSRRARSSIQARYLLPEATVSPANSAATTIADRNSSERGTVPASSTWTAAMIAPASSSPAASRARIRDSCAATVYSATSSATSPSSGNAEQPLGERDGAGGQEDRGRVATADDERRDQRGLHDGRAVAGPAGPGQPRRAQAQQDGRQQRVAGQRVGAGQPAPQAEQPAGDLVGWLLWRARRHRSQGRSGKPGHGAQCASFVVAYRQRTRPLPGDPRMSGIVAGRSGYTGHVSDLRMRPVSRNSSSGRSRRRRAAA